VLFLEDAVCGADRHGQQVNVNVGDELLCFLDAHGWRALAGGVGAFDDVANLGLDADALGVRPIHHPLGDRIDDHRSVAMPLLDGELVHRDHRNPAEIHRAQALAQPPFVDSLHSIPVQIEVLRNVFHRHVLAQTGNRFRQAVRHHGCL